MMLISKSSRVPLVKEFEVESEETKQQRLQ